MRLERVAAPDLHREVAGDARHRDMVARGEATVEDSAGIDPTKPFFERLAEQVLVPDVEIDPGPDDEAAVAAEIPAVDRVARLQTVEHEVGERTPLVDSTRLEQRRRDEGRVLPRGLGGIRGVGVASGGYHSLTTRLERIALHCRGIGHGCIFPVLYANLHVAKSDVARVILQADRSFERLAPCFWQRGLVVILDFAAVEHDADSRPAAGHFEQVPLSGRMHRVVARGDVSVERTAGVDRRRFADVVE